MASLEEANERAENLKKNTKVILNLVTGQKSQGAMSKIGDAMGRVLTPRKLYTAKENRPPPEVKTPRRKSTGLLQSVFSMRPTPSGQQSTPSGQQSTLSAAGGGKKEKHKSLEEEREIKIGVLRKEIIQKRKDKLTFIIYYNNIIKVLRP